MQKKTCNLRNVVMILVLSLSLNGCVLYEQIRMQLNLERKTGTIQYFNIVSAIEEKDSYWSNETEREEFFEKLQQVRKDDLRQLIREYYDYSIDSGHNEIIAKKLFKKNKQLNGIEKFKLEDLSGFDILTSSDSSKYMIKLDPDSRYIAGNGIYLETDTGKFVYWRIDVKHIDLTIKLYDLNHGFAYVESMLSDWQQWKRTN